MFLFGLQPITFSFKKRHFVFLSNEIYPFVGSRFLPTLGHELKHMLSHDFNGYEYFERKHNE